MIINNIYKGDSLQLMKELDDNSIDLVITSPPYADLKKYIDFDGIHPDKYVEWFIPYCKEIERIIKPTGSFILNINDKVQNKIRHPYVIDLISTLHKETNLLMYERLFWNKKKSLPNRARFGDRVEYLFWFVKDSKKFYINFDEMRTEYCDSSITRMKQPLQKRFSRKENESKEKKSWSPNTKGALPSTLINISSETKKIVDNHVAVYPVELAEYFIKGATKEGDLILDPFMGTGTSGVAAKRNNRNWIGFEMQEEYIKKSLERIKNG